MTDNFGNEIKIVDGHGNKIELEYFSEADSPMFGEWGTKVYRVTELKRLLVGTIGWRLPGDMKEISWDEIRGLIACSNSFGRCVGFDPANDDLPY